MEEVKQELPPLKLLKREDLNRFDTIKLTGKNFVTEVDLNARDAMVFGVVKTLPEDEADAVEMLTEFRGFVQQHCGGKTITSFPKEMDMKLAEKAGYKIQFGAENNPNYYIDADVFAGKLEEMKAKKEVKAHLQSLKEGKLTLVNQDALAKKPAALYEFKRKNADFVTRDEGIKLKQGIYSERAEQLKCTNPHNKHYALQLDGKIIGCVMLTKHDDKIYIADYIVAENEVGKKYAQAMIVAAYEDAMQDAQWKDTKGLWLIAGGKAKDEGINLYEHLFGAVLFDDKVQMDQRMIICFGKPGPVLLNKANRSLEGPDFLSLDGKTHDVEFKVQVKDAEVLDEELSSSLFNSVAN